MTDHEIATAMKTYGGGFYSRLAEAWFHGDLDNRLLIQTTWAERWREYEDLARLYAERQKNASA